jgi:hemin uptake protein HemP
MTYYPLNKGTLEMPENEQQAPPTNMPSDLQAKIHRSEDLFEGRRQVLIAHGTEVYRLLHTKNGKLILQK